jgi:hypothetical protein
MPQTGLNMPPGSISEGTPSKAIDGARKTSRDSWNKHGNNTAADALANDKATIRKNIDPKSLGPTSAGK